MLPEWFALVSVFVRLIGGGQYARGVLKRKTFPNPISWFLWGLTPMIAFFAQITVSFSVQSFVLLALGITPLIICTLSLKLHGIRQHLTPFSLSCGAIAIIGVILWRVTSYPELAILFGIAADIFATLPTLQKAYCDHTSEYALPYLISAASMAITLLAIHDWAFTIYAFPLYMLCINVVILIFASLPLRSIIKTISITSILEKRETFEDS
jgi:hypothetical protein